MKLGEIVAWAKADPDRELMILHMGQELKIASVRCYEGLKLITFNVATEEELAEAKQRAEEAK